ncbi:winged helix DNA-binding domain-containing protein [Paludibacter sp.]|uniref:winged helix DNA-binding domain-containing protein n=1 Tax=Paludibacter sp. TaxID=1898105 RepID=UPI00135497A4|nr:winged helix DNA-binding domain-containing protein [Paludibacter sp.]MTK53188.1 winged helix DNA-binding domain-containing protein [Paludibacter sp.]
MTLQEITTLRLQNQQIITNHSGNIVSLVEKMGALQAQDYAMAKWALGVRMSSVSDESVNEAIASASIIRTHVLRPTWHFVPARDVVWMTRLSADRIKTSMRTRDRQLELTEDVFTSSNNILATALADGKSMTREEIALLLQQKGIRTNENRLSHLLMRAELELIICSGAYRRGKPSFRLLEKCISNPIELSREESLSTLAKRYFSAHGPATIADFVWWSGLSQSEAKQGIEANKHAFESLTINGQIYWMNRDSQADTTANSLVHLLPAFDEYLISYRDRSAMIASHHNPKTIYTNGVFRPVVVVNGKVAGLWSRTIKKEVVTVSIAMFDDFSDDVRSLIKKSVKPYGVFLGKIVDLTIKAI